MDSQLFKLKYALATLPACIRSVHMHFNSQEAIQTAMPSFTGYLHQDFQPISFITLSVLYSYNINIRYKSSCLIKIQMF